MSELWLECLLSTLYSCLCHSNLGLPLILDVIVRLLSRQKSQGAAPYIYREVSGRWKGRDFTCNIPVKLFPFQLPMQRHLFGKMGPDRLQACEIPPHGLSLSNAAIESNMSSWFPATAALSWLFRCSSKDVFCSTADWNLLLHALWGHLIWF